jgi:hypothetical protein
MTESGDQAGVSFGNQEEDNSWLYTDHKENGSAPDSSRRVSAKYYTDFRILSETTNFALYNCFDCFYQENKLIFLI